MTTGTITPQDVADKINLTNRFRKTYTSDDVQLMRIGYGTRIHISLNGRSVCLIEQNKYTIKNSQYKNYRDVIAVADLCGRCSKILIAYFYGGDE
jgi:hypothetical protein